MGSSAKQFKFLHISDLHAGQDSQDWLWPTLQTGFFDDLDRIIPSMGGLDLVIFSGDLTQRGSEADFIVLERLLNRLWEKFDKLGCAPSLFFVPGNHDLVRPDPYDPTAAAMCSWWSNSNVKNGFWMSDNNAYRDFVQGLFRNYSNFKSRLSQNKFPICATVDGAIPGDSSYVIIKEDVRLGIVGLNTSYLQLSDSDELKLDLDVRQLLAVTNGDPDAWCRANHVNLLITHHPISWLAEQAATHLLGEIYPPGRFTAHLFGHMHEPDFQVTSKGGSLDRKLIQAASLYGLRKYGRGKLDRIHGYSGARIELSDQKNYIKIWPRIDTVVTSGARRFVADTRFDLNEQNNFELPLGKIQGFDDNIGLEIISTVQSFGSVQQEAATSAQGKSPALGSQPLKLATQHSAVRRLEQSKLKLALEKHRAAWLSADWGYAADDFISSATSTLSSAFSATYRISLHDYKDRDSFLVRFSSLTGHSFQEFCKSISGVERVLLLLEDVPISRNPTPENSSREADIESIVDAIREYCTNSLVILISRQLPIFTSFPVIEIKPLDEADVRAYLLHHPLGGPEHAGAEEVSAILRLTGGLPLQIDSILKELEFVSLSELVEIRLNSPRSELQGAESYDGLLPLIEGLKNSSDSNASRAFGLLVALSAFPYGESFARIRRFNQQLPFHSSHASTLADRGLIETVANGPTLRDSLKSGTHGPKLVAKKIVRDTVESLLSYTQIDERNSRAASMYFGDKWNIGEPKNMRMADLAKALGGDGGLGNPHAIINSLLQRAVEVGEEKRIDKAVQLARLFIANLDNGDNYRSSATACADFMKIIPPTPNYENDFNWLKCSIIRSQRMLGQTEAALNLCEQIDTSYLDRRERSRFLLNWALALQYTDKPKAKEIALQVVSLGKTNFTGMHAQSLALQLSPEDPKRLEKLKELEDRARRKKAITTANTIAFFIASSSNGPENEIRLKLRNIAASARKNGDPYSEAQAMVKISSLAHDGAGELTKEDLSGLISAYHYLFNERINTLFRQCHAGLWRYFLHHKDIENMLRLFRHSSFIWRIYDKEILEKPYIDQLTDLLSGDDGRTVAMDTAENAYFLMRAERMRISTAT